MEKETIPGVGLDVGTMNIVASRQGKDGKVVTKRVRDAFLDLDAGDFRLLKMSKVQYVELDKPVEHVGEAPSKQLFVIGDSAFSLANLFKREARRPLSKGVITPGELDAQRILGVLVANVLDEPRCEKEHCYYSVPAIPVDVDDQDIVYHTEIFRRILHEQGYTPHPMNEAMAIIYSQCASTEFSGLSVSFGSGMCNVALAYQAVLGMSFSVARGGDWIDTHTSKAVGSTPARVCAIKEKGVDIVNPVGREAEALALYYRSIIRYCLDNISVQFKKVRGQLDLQEPIPFIVSGGTSKAQGFLDVFKQEFGEVKKKGFPIQVSDIIAAKDPLTAVAEGLLVLANEEGA
jgi:hypothetical protein